MKNLNFASFVLLAALAITASGQVKSGGSASNQPAAKPANVSHGLANVTRARVLSQGTKAIAPGENVASAETLQAHAKVDFNDHAKATPKRDVSAATDKSSPSIAPGSSKTGSTNMKPAVSNNTAPSSSNSVANAATPVATVLGQVYRVGVNDVLDIQLADNHGAESSLFTVLEGGLLEYPLAGNPIPVAGLTTGEIAGILGQRIKIFENPVVVVNVREYASHSLIITGFVGAPGTKILRREAIPLYAILAEALVLPEAARATITRQGRQPIVVDLKDPNLSATLVLPGDAIKVSGTPPGPTEFFFTGGEIKSPGQKPYHAGLTLTQAILASGGTTPSAGPMVRVSRQGADGRLITEEYNLRKIQAGKIPDPALQKGDRIEVSAAN